MDLGRAAVEIGDDAVVAVAAVQDVEMAVGDVALGIDVVVAVAAVS